MLQNKIEKIKTLFGFSIKSKSIIFGFDNIIKHKKNNIFCIIASNDANCKQVDKIFNKFENLNVNVYKTINNNLEYFLQRNCKFVAMLNENLAKPIIENVEEFKNIKRGEF